MPDIMKKEFIYVEDRETSWQLFLEDLAVAAHIIQIDFPDIIEEDMGSLRELIHILHQKHQAGVEVKIRASEDVCLPKELQPYILEKTPYHPITIIDNQTIWFGHPMFAGDFIAEGNILDTTIFPCIRFVGPHFARSLQSFLEM